MSDTVDAAAVDGVVASGGGGGGGDGGRGDKGSRSAAAGDGGGDGGVGVRLVVQRCNGASLLIDNASTWCEIGWGLVCSVAFGPAADERLVARAASLLLSAPLLSRGHWGDGTTPKSVVDMCLQAESTDVNGDDADLENAVKPEVMVIPTASLVSKPKQGGKVISYRGQCEKERSRQLYALFINTLRTSSGAMIDARGGLEGGGGSRAGAAATSASHTATAKKQKKQARDAAAATCPPQDLFRVGEYEGKFATFDADGLPLTDADGEAVTKSQRKKLEKLQRKHAERWEKHNLKATTSTANDIESSVSANASASADPGADGEINTDAGTTCSAASVVAGRPTDDPNPTAVPTAKTDSHATLSGNGVDAAAASDGRSSSHTDPLSRSPQGGSPGKSSQQDAPQGEIETIANDNGSDGRLRVVAGTFGNRQGFRLDAELGPFTHVFNF